ncbi:hypothetical protein Pmani_026208 [Petrolisthes manimaculis]|uniref:C2H2-type domain-containing protein n=1 Tax=Petrolisthes manimaculis TaxID=1843537 RepID=A0AAE1P3W3_9EUCA|nr:hypothetical protein Pmani_026208 [Petrolisthes manimaculis]
MGGCSVPEPGSSSPQGLTCPFCHHMATNKFALCEHVRQHTGGWGYVCTQCNYKTNRSHDLKRHLQSRHQGTLQRPYRCPVTGGGTGDHFSGQSATIATNLTTTTVLLPEQCVIQGTQTCPFCPYRSFSNTDMGRHIRQHTRDSPYRCHHCNYQTTRSNDLKRHVQSRHEGRILRPYRCSLCYYRTTQLSYLHQHIASSHPGHSDSISKPPQTSSHFHSN